MTNESKKQFLGERVRALATVLLTRRSDLTIVDTKKDTGLDFHVYIEREDKPMRLTFGVLLRGVPSPVTANHAKKVLGPTMGQFQGMRKFTYPVCLFFFTMREEHAFFSWLAEPVVTDGAPKLVHHDKAKCVPLTDEFLGQVVEQIVAWYDAVESVLIA
ncbi:MAG TPA: hypothetical protein VGY77_05905 [Gemmataceae bacterium]|nr:hypothetical protein [Gemmataceae bacterium]